jgi:hypothetical protein
MQNRKDAYQFTGSGKQRDQRKLARTSANATAWFRSEGAFAVRSCKVVDLSRSGVQMSVAPGEQVPEQFVFLKSRNTNSGQRARVKWRRGRNIGAEFY